MKTYPKQTDFRKLKPESEKVLEDHEEKHGKERTDQIRVFMELFSQLSPRQRQNVHKDIQERNRRLEKSN